MMQPEATPAPIHDIVGPVSFLPFPIWMLVAGAIAVLAALGWLVWFFALRKRAAPTATPSEVALAAFRELDPKVESTAPHEFTIEVSDVLRSFLRDERGLQATTQTSIEFLESVRERGTFTPGQQEALEHFLEKADLIKFARIHATPADSRELFDAAVGLVNQSIAEAREFDAISAAGGKTR